MILYPLLRKALFQLTPEAAHHVTMSALSIALKTPGLSAMMKQHVAGEEQLRKTIAGISFPNPVGMAAGFDKNALYVEDLTELGFGYVEIGTVTPKPQPGNPKPRLFRLPKDKALINRMGFNNDGAQVITRRLEKLRAKGSKAIVGGNIGKNKITPNERAHDDYALCFDALQPYVDYFVLNVSSPNTPGLRALQDKDALEILLDTVQNRNYALNKRKPLFLKIAPDLNNSQLDEILQLAEAKKLDGLIATNTTISRDGLLTNPRMVKAIGDGGLSGLPLRSRSMEILQHLARNKNRELILVSSGGIMNGDDAVQRIKAGAELIQLYTGFIYEGPGILKDIKKKLLAAV